MTARRTSNICIAALLGLWLWPAGAATAQEIGDAAAGRQLADAWCGSCHVAGPTAARGVSNGVPTFAGIARRKSTTAMSLRVFLQSPHARMPDLHLSRDEIADVSAYILSLRSR